MAEYATKEEVQQIVETTVDKAVKALSEVVIDMSQQIHAELEIIQTDVKDLKLDMKVLKKQLFRTEATEDRILDFLIKTTKYQRLIKKP